jgi:hypothetical protein
MYRDSVYNYARTLARMSGFSRQVRINGRSVAEADAESIHDVIVVDEEDDGASDVKCRTQFDIINRLVFWMLYSSSFRAALLFIYRILHTVGDVINLIS